MNYKFYIWLLFVFTSVTSLKAERRWYFGKNLGFPPPAWVNPAPPPSASSNRIFRTAPAPSSYNVAPTPYFGGSIPPAATYFPTLPGGTLNSPVIYPPGVTIQNGFPPLEGVPITTFPPSYTPGLPGTYINPNISPPYGSSYPSYSYPGMAQSQPPADLHGGGDATHPGYAESTPPAGEFGSPSYATPSGLTATAAPRIFKDASGSLFWKHDNGTVVSFHKDYGYLGRYENGFPVWYKDPTVEEQLRMLASGSSSPPSSTTTPPPKPAPPSEVPPPAPISGQKCALIAVGKASTDERWEDIKTQGDLLAKGFALRKKFDKVHRMFAETDLTSENLSQRIKEFANTCGDIEIHLLTEGCQIKPGTSFNPSDLIPALKELNRKSATVFMNNCSSENFYKETKELNNLCILSNGVNNPIKFLPPYSTAAPLAIYRDYYYDCSKERDEVKRRFCSHPTRDSDLGYKFDSAMPDALSTQPVSVFDAYLDLSPFETFSESLINIRKHDNDVLKRKERREKHKLDLYSLHKDPGLTLGKDGRPTVDGLIKEGNNVYEDLKHTELTGPEQTELRKRLEVYNTKRLALNELLKKDRTAATTKTEIVTATQEIFQAFRDLKHYFAVMRYGQTRNISAASGQADRRKNYLKEFNEDHGTQNHACNRRMLTPMPNAPVEPPKPVPPMPPPPKPPEPGPFVPAVVQRLKDIFGQEVRHSPDYKSFEILSSSPPPEKSVLQARVKCLDEPSGMGAFFSFEPTHPNITVRPGVNFNLSKLNEFEKADIKKKFADCFKAEAPPGPPPPKPPETRPDPPKPTPKIDPADLRTAGDLFGDSITRAKGTTFGTEADDFSRLKLHKSWEPRLQALKDKGVRFVLDTSTKNASVTLTPYLKKKNGTEEALKTSTPIVTRAGVPDLIATGALMKFLESVEKDPKVAGITVAPPGPPPPPANFKHKFSDLGLHGTIDPDFGARTFVPEATKLYAQELTDHGAKVTVKDGTMTITGPDNAKLSERADLKLNGTHGDRNVLIASAFREALANLKASKIKSIFGKEATEDTDLYVIEVPKDTAESVKNCLNAARDKSGLKSTQINFEVAGRNVGFNRNEATAANFNVLLKNAASFQDCFKNAARPQPAKYVRCQETDESKAYFNKHKDVAAKTRRNEKGGLLPRAEWYSD